MKKTRKITGDRTTDWVVHGSATWALLMFVYALGMGCSSEEPSAKPLGNEGGQAGSGGSGGLGAVGGSGGQDNGLASVEAAAQCSVVPQSGCAVGHTCLVANSSGSTSCYSAGTQGYGAKCSSINDCDVGLICVYGQCRSLCNSTGDCAGSDFATCSDVGSTPQSLPGLKMCSIMCNPADSKNNSGNSFFTPCLEGTMCYLSGERDGATECYTAGNASAGDPCPNGAADCGADLVCLSDGSGNQSCTHFCLMDGSTNCPSGTCYSFDTPMHVGTSNGLTELGFCQ